MNARATNEEEADSARAAPLPKRPGPARPRNRWLSRAIIAASILLVLVVVVRLVLDPIAAHETRKALNGLPDLRGDFDRVHVTIFGPGYTITRLKLIEEPGGNPQKPLFFAESVHVGVDWRRLLHAELVASARVVEPKVVVLNRPRPPTPKEERHPPDLSVALQKITPLKVARVEVLRGELLFEDLTLPRHPELWVHHLELAAENLPTRESKAGGRPTTLSARGQVGRSGDMTLFVTAAPLASPLAFAGRFELAGLRVAELYEFLEPKTKLQAPRGTLDVFADFRAKGGRLTGGVKPLLKNVEVTAAEPGAWDRVKAWLADKAVKLASDRVPERNAVATVIPLEGELTDPDIQLGPAIFGVVRNAFVVGMVSGFARLPPPKAEEKQGLLTQVKDALQKDKGPPKAQPSDEGTAKEEGGPRKVQARNARPPKDR